MENMINTILDYEDLLKGGIPNKDLFIIKGRSIGKSSITSYQSIGRVLRDIKTQRRRLRLNIILSKI